MLPLRICSAAWLICLGAAAPLAFAPMSASAEPAAPPLAGAAAGTLACRAPSALPATARETASMRKRSVPCCSPPGQIARAIPREPLGRADDRGDAGRTAFGVGGAWCSAEPRRRFFRPDAARSSRWRGASSCAILRHLSACTPPARSLDLPEVRAEMAWMTCAVEKSSERGRRSSESSVRWCTAASCAVIVGYDESCPTDAPASVIADKSARTSALLPSTSGT